MPLQDVYIGELHAIPEVALRTGRTEEDLQAFFLQCQSEGIVCSFTTSTYDARPLEVIELERGALRIRRREELIEEIERWRNETYYDTINLFDMGDVTALARFIRDLEERYVSRTPPSTDRSVALDV